eukprot:496753_1
MAERKFHNKQNCFILGLTKLFIQKYFCNKMYHFQLGKHLVSKKAVRYVSKAENSVYAEVTDPNDKHINHVVLNFLTVPVLSEADIHPIETICDCNTFQMALHNYTNSNRLNPNKVIIREVMCPDIAAALLAVQDDSSTFSKFVSMSTIREKDGLVIIDDMVFKVNKLHPVCLSPAQMVDDLVLLDYALRDKYSAYFFGAYSNTLRTTKIVCNICNKPAHIKFIDGKYSCVHQCYVFNSNNVNKYKNKSISVLQLSLLYSDVDFTKFNRIFIKLMKSKYVTNEEIAEELTKSGTKTSSHLVGTTLHRIAKVCRTMMNNTVQFGSREHPDVEVDATKTGHKYYGDTTNPSSFEQTWCQTIVQRDPTAKGQKPANSLVGGAESIQNYGYRMVRVIGYGGNVNSDHVLYRSNYVNNKWRSMRAVHSKGEFVSEDTSSFPARLKAHGNTAEQYNDQLKTQRRVHRGLGRINKGKKDSQQEWISIQDWNRTFTNGKPKDLIVVFLQHCCMLLKQQMPVLLKKNRYKEF